MAHLIPWIFCALALAQDPAAEPTPVPTEETAPAEVAPAEPAPAAPASPTALGEALRQLAATDAVESARGRAALQAAVANAPDAATRDALVAELLAFASAPSIATASGDSLEFEAGLEPWLAAIATEAAKVLDTAALQAADAAARREAVRWAGYVAVAADADKFATLLDSDLAWADALNALMQLPDNAGARAVLARLPTETSTDKQMEYVRALGQFQVLEARGPLSDLAKSTVNRALAFTALDALARMGVPPVDVVKRPGDASPEELTRYANDGLRAAQELLDHGQAKKAANLFRFYCDSSGLWYQIRAGMLGLLASGSLDAPRTALGYLNTPRLRESAQRILIDSKIAGTEEMLDKAYEVGDTPMKASLLEVFAARGGEAGRKKIEEALAGGTADVRVAAARLLGQRPNETDLLELATSGAPWARQAAVSGFLDEANAKLLAGDDEGAAAQFRAILQQRLGPEAERAAIEGLGQCGTYDDNDLISTFQGAPDTGPAAYAAKARLALKNPEKDDIIHELETIAEVSPYEEGIFAAAAGLAQLGQPSTAHARRRGYLVDWMALGPFPDEGGAAFGISFITEARADAIQYATWQGKQYTWEKAPVAGLPPVADLRALYTDTQNHAAYAFSKFSLSKPMAAELQLSVGGAFELWLNGQNVAGDPTPHTWKQDEVRVPVTLNAGINKVLLKVLRDGESWRCSVRVADRRGKPVDLEVQRPARDGSEGVGVTSGRAATVMQKAAP